MKIKISLCITSLFFLFASSCEKDNQITSKAVSVADTDCYNFPLPTGSSGYELEQASKIWSGAVFNPNDNNQIAYGVEYSDHSQKAFKSFFSNPNNSTQIPACGPWSMDGWILSEDFGGNLFKVRENGESQIPLHTFTSMNFYPDWSPDGKKIVFNGVVNTKFAGLFVMNADGTGQKSLDSIRGTKPCWSPDGMKIAYCVDYENIAYFDTITKQKIIVKELSDDDAIWGMSWFPDSKWLVYSISSGLYKINIDTKQTVLLRSFCDSRIYQSPCVSNNGKIMVTKRDSKIIGSSIKYSEYHVVMMNADGTNETKIDLK